MRSTIALVRPPVGEPRWLEEAVSQARIVRGLESQFAHFLIYPIVKMTTHDYDMTMKRVRIADLKARLSEHLRYVKRGHTLTVLDRDTPVARLVPVDEPVGLAVRHAAGSAASIADVPVPPRLKLAVDPVELLLADRNSGR